MQDFKAIVRVLIIVAVLVFIILLGSLTSERASREAAELWVALRELVAEWRTLLVLLVLFFGGAFLLRWVLDTRYGRK